MAGSNESSRQKMINLMYLVFIAMLALNMSKEVLSAFGQINKRLVSNSAKASEKNALAFEGLAVKASENEEKYGALFENAKQVKTLSASLFNYLDSLKTQMKSSVKDPEDYELMDKTDYLDQLFFNGDNYSPYGKTFVKNIDHYRQGIVSVLGERFKGIQNAVIANFDTGGETGKVKNREGKSVDWLNYEFEGFPLITSLTKISQIQTDIKNTESEILSAMLEGQLTAEVSYSNYTTLLETPKSAYYQNETFDGNIVLGRKDATTKPNRVELKLDGRPLSSSEYSILDGRVQLKANAGRAGDHEITGNLIFTQDGEEVVVPVNQSFSVITKPNAAVVSADKMNVVYRGVENPMTISIPGISDNLVNASAPGLRKASGSKYILNPGTGREVTITASGTLPDGQRISTPTVFRIKDIPRPSGTISGQTDQIKLPRRNVEIATIGAVLEDFDFDLKLVVNEFKFKVPGQPTVLVSGNKLNNNAKNALRRAKRGETIQIFDINASISNNRSYKLKKVSPVLIDLVD